MNPFEFVIVVIALSFVYKLLAAWMRSREQSRSSDESRERGLWCSDSSNSKSACKCSSGSSRTNASS